MPADLFIPNYMRTNATYYLDETIDHAIVDPSITEDMDMRTKWQQRFVRTIRNERPITQSEWVEFLETLTKDEFHIYYVHMVLRIPIRHVPGVAKDRVISLARAVREKARHYFGED